MGDSKVVCDVIPIIDAHCDSILDVLYGRRQLGMACDHGQADFPRLSQAGVRVQFFAVFIESKYKPHGAVMRTLEGIEAFYQEMEQNLAITHLIRTKRDLDASFLGKKLGVVLTVEGGEALGGQLWMLNILYRLGVRSVGLTWNQGNDLADGVGVGRQAKGLTTFGKAAVRQMNDLGMLVDLAHIAEKGFWDTLAVSEKPVIVSHANCYQLCPHPRNLTDEQLRALAQQGGCLGITYVPEFIDDRQPHRERVIDHIEHAVQVMGVDHVGLGSDFDGTDNRIVGLDTAIDLPDLLLGLKNRGFSDENIRKIAGGNWYRLLHAILP